MAECWITKSDEVILKELETSAKNLMQAGRYNEARGVWMSLKDYTVSIQHRIDNKCSTIGAVIGGIVSLPLSVVFVPLGAFAGYRITRFMVGNSVYKGRGLKDIIQLAEDNITLCRLLIDNQK